MDFNDVSSQFWSKVKKAFNTFNKSELTVIHKILTEYRNAKNDDKALTLQLDWRLDIMVWIAKDLINKKRK